MAEVEILAASNAADRGLRALADRAAAAAGSNYRVVGGHIVHLLGRLTPPTPLPGSPPTPMPMPMPMPMPTWKLSQRPMPRPTPRCSPGARGFRPITLPASGLLKSQHLTVPLGGFFSSGNLRWNQPPVGFAPHDSGWRLRGLRGTSLGGS